MAGSSVRRAISTAWAKRAGSVGLTAANRRPGLPRQRPRPQRGVLGRYQGEDLVDQPFTLRVLTHFEDVGVAIQGCEQPLGVTVLKRKVGGLEPQRSRFVLSAQSVQARAQGRQDAVAETVVRQRPAQRAKRGRVVRGALVERETVERFVAGGDAGPHDGGSVADRGPCSVVVGDLAGRHRRVARRPLERLADAPVEASDPGVRKAAEDGVVDERVGEGEPPSLEFP